jgi:NTE family protein
MRLSKLLFPALFAFSLAANADERPRVALVLGGGGARGLAHLGVLKVLEQARIPVDCVVGTSMGALIGGVYADGQSASEIEASVRHIDWADVLDDRPARVQRTYHDKQDDALGMMGLGLGLSDDGQLLFPQGAIGTHKVDLLIRGMVDNVAPDHFDQLPLPFRAVASDLETGDMVVLSRGDLASAMRASMAVPGVFPPVERDMHILVDGGVARNLPVDVARGVCGDMVIAVDVSSPLLKRKAVKDVLSISEQTLRVLMQKNVDDQIAQMGRHDVLIAPDLGAMSPTDFRDTDAAIAAGEAAARDALPKMINLALSEDEYRKWRANLVAKIRKSPPIQAVTVEPTRFVNPAVVKEVLDVKTGQVLDVPHLNAELSRLYARGDFDQIDYRLVSGAAGGTLDVYPHEKPWGPGYLDLGLGLRTDFNDDSAFQLSAQYRRAWLNKLGGEWKTRAYIGTTRGIDTDLYQPLTLDGTAFVDGGGKLDNAPFDVYLNGARLAEYRRADRHAFLDIGSNWGRWGELRLGLERGKLSFDEATGATDLPQGIVNIGGARLALVYDQLDDARYPREGSYVRVDLYNSLHSFGATDSYHRSQLEAKQAEHFGSWSVLLGMHWDRAPNTPVDEMPSAGGLFNLSGYQPGELRAQGIDQFSLRVSQDVSQFSPLFGTAGFWGAAFEAGKLWHPFDTSLDPDHWLNSTSLFVGSDTRIGPAYFALSASDKGRVRTYLTINGQF